MIDNENARVVLVDTAHPHPARNRAPCLSSGSNHRMTSIAVSPDGRWAAAGGWKEDGIYIWDLPRRKLDCILPPSDDNFDCTFAVSFSPDGRWLASCSHNPSAPGHYLWDVGTWKRHSYLPEHHGFLASPVFSHDGRLLARNVSLQQIRLVEAATGRTIAHLSTLQPLKQTPLAFSPDGTRLIAIDQSQDSASVRSQADPRAASNDGSGLGPAAISGGSQGTHSSARPIDPGRRRGAGTPRSR